MGDCAERVIECSDGNNPTCPVPIGIGGNYTHWNAFCNGEKLFCTSEPECEIDQYPCGPDDQCSSLVYECAALRHTDCQYSRKYCYDACWVRVWPSPFHSSFFSFDSCLFRMEIGIVFVHWILWVRIVKPTDHFFVISPLWIRSQAAFLTLIKSWTKSNLILFASNLVSSKPSHSLTPSTVSSQTLLTSKFVFFLLLCCEFFPLFNGEIFLEIRWWARSLWLLCPTRLWVC